MRESAGVLTIRYARDRAGIRSRTVVIVSSDVEIPPFATVQELTAIRKRMLLRPKDDRGAQKAIGRIDRLLAWAAEGAARRTHLREEVIRQLPDDFVYLDELGFWVDYDPKDGYRAVRASISYARSQLRTKGLP
jgi:hypothetical protein